MYLFFCGIHACISLQNTLSMSDMPVLLGVILTKGFSLVQGRLRWGAVRQLPLLPFSKDLIILVQRCL